jgi:hypothetical protein
MAAKAKEVTETSVETMYIVQERREDLKDEKDNVVIAWTELGTYKVKGGQRAAIKTAMDEHGLEDGDYRALSPSAAKVHSPKTKTHLSWD